LYQLYFKAAGIEYACNAFSTAKKPDEKVNLDIKMRPIQFLGGIRVSLGTLRIVVYDLIEQHT
jgi:hypothetical protein